MRVATAQISYTGVEDQLVLDTTVKSAKGQGRLLMPTWEIVLSSKSGKLSWTGYTQTYREMLRQRYLEQPNEFIALLNEDRVVVFKCYCNAKVKPHCHRYLLVDIFRQLAEYHHQPFQYLGEL